MVDVEVEQASALLIETIVVTERRMTVAPPGLAADRSDDREEARRIAPMDQQVEIPLAA